MLRMESETGWWLITHRDHARLAGAFAEAWGNALFRRPEPRARVLHGIASHDDGWVARDAQPVITREGKPSAFSTELVGVNVDRLVGDPQSPRDGLARQAGLQQQQHFVLAFRQVHGAIARSTRRLGHVAGPLRDQSVPDTAQGRENLDRWRVFRHVIRGTPANHFLANDTLVFHAEHEHPGSIRSRDELSEHPIGTLRAEPVIEQDDIRHPRLDRA